MPRFSILTSLYRSAPYINEFYDRTLAVIEKLGGDYEFVFVDDGSPDEGNDIVKALIERDPNVRLVELSRNFGHHKAIMIGLENVQGDLVFMLDSDLEEEPELLEKFYSLMMDTEDDIDVVYGVMGKRKGGLLERLPGALFYKIINILSDHQIPENVMAARLMRREFVENVVRYQETQLYLGGIMTLVGFNQVEYVTTKSSKGHSTYNWSRKISLALDALISYTNKPLTFIAFLGIGICFISLLMVAGFVLQLLSGGGEVEGWIYVLASIWFLGGLTILAIGMVGFYVGRIFIQVKQRPNAIIKKIHNGL
jgi:putative glycosyltransferase